jgi:SnoaL-like protein
MRLETERRPKVDFSLVDLETWITGYGRAWETADEDLIASLFTEEASYRSSPFREPYVGHDAIRAYWRRGAGTQRGTKVRMGRPFGSGQRVAVEWWATLSDDDGEVTLPGCLLLRLEPDGRCSDLREYWNAEDGHREPFHGWGT